MAANVNLDGFQDHGYFSRAWALVTQEKGWWKPVLLLGLATLVPIVGPIAVLGYCLEWARRIAWGSTAAPERHVKVGELLASGWRGIVVLLGWAIVSGIVGGILGKVPVLGGLLGFAWSIFSIFLGMLFMVAAARATIYQSFKAGYRAKTIWEMGRRDPMGLLRVWLIRLVSGIVIGFVSLCIVVPAIVKVIPYAINFFEYGYYGYASDYEILYFLSPGRPGPGHHLDRRDRAWARSCGESLDLRGDRPVAAPVRRPRLGQGRGPAASERHRCRGAQRPAQGARAV